jgi:hypothetical protein
MPRIVESEVVDSPTDQLMPRRAAFILLLALSSPVSAGSSSGFLPDPDPALRNATPAQIRERAEEACIVLQARLMEMPQEMVRDECRCYARRTVARMTKQDIEDFRRTSIFNGPTREKALESLDACGLKRP